MLDLDKYHDPRKNGELLVKITGKQLDMKAAIKETELLFQQCSQHEPRPQINNKSTPVPFYKKMSEWLYRLFAKPFILLEPTRIQVDSVGNVYPEWKTKLDEEYGHLLNVIKKEVNILDVGGIGDGKTDNTKLLKKRLEMDE